MYCGHIVSYLLDFSRGGGGENIKETPANS